MKGLLQTTEKYGHVFNLSPAVLAEVAAFFEP